MATSVTDPARGDAAVDTDFCPVVEIGRPYRELAAAGERTRTGRLHAIPRFAASSAAGVALCGHPFTAAQVRAERSWASVTPAGRCRVCDLEVARSLLSYPAPLALEERSVLDRLVAAASAQGGPLGPVVLDLLLGCPVWAADLPHPETPLPAPRSPAA